LNDKKERILAAALELFTTRGFQDTPTALIAKTAGVATGTLFNHYRNKEQLINSLYLYCKQELSRCMAVEPGAGPHDFIHHLGVMWRNSIDYILAHPRVLLFFDQYSHSPYINQISKETGKSLFKLHGNLLIEGMNAGLIKDLPVELLHELTWSMIASTVRYLLDHPEQQDDQQLREKAFATLMEALRA